VLVLELISLEDVPYVK